MSEAIAAEPYGLFVGHWKEETYAIHGPSGHIASGVQPSAARAIVDELNRLSRPAPSRVAELERQLSVSERFRNDQVEVIAALESQLAESREREIDWKSTALAMLNSTYEKRKALLDASLAAEQEKK